LRQYQVEDETHFMLNCTRYEILRRVMWHAVEKITGVRKAQFVTDEEKLNALIGDRFQPPEDEDEQDEEQVRNYRKLIRAVMKYITTAMNQRRGLQR